MATLIHGCAFLIALSAHVGEIAGGSTTAVHTLRVILKADLGAVRCLGGTTRGLIEALAFALGILGRTRLRVRVMSIEYNIGRRAAPSSRIPKFARLVRQSFFRY